MAFLVSPGVQVKEVDLTNVVPAVATSIGAIAGAFEKGGPANRGTRGRGRGNDADPCRLQAAVGP